MRLCVSILLRRNLRLFLWRQIHECIKWGLHFSRRKNKCQIILTILRLLFYFKCLRCFLFPVWVVTDIALHITWAPKILNNFWTLYLRIIFLIQNVHCILNSEISIFLKKMYLRDMWISEEIIYSELLIRL